VAARRFLRVLSEGEPALFRDGSGRRELAEAIASPRNPLTARVMVNRLWGLVFGRPLVDTPSNFGATGAPPTHPELLDDLAVRFMEGGWSVKALLRELVLSSTYRQASRADPAKAARDGPNELLGRMNRRRLTVEQWRDAALFAAGELAESGPPTLALDDPENRRRTVYARVSRLQLNDLMAQFDYPDANVHAEGRAVTTTPTQKLFMLNSPFALARAKGLAARLTADPNASDRARVSAAYRLLFSREAGPEEIQLALAFLARPGGGSVSRWEQYAQALLASNVMLYLD
jgi:hypothetical protein